MAVLKSSLVLSLVDQVSGRARRINGAIDSIQRQSSSLLGVTARLAAFGGAYLGMSQGWSRTYTAAADAQAALSEIGIKADMSSAQLAGLQQRLTKLSPTVNQSTTDLLAGVDAMTTLGLSAGDAEAALPAIAKAATATGSSLADLSAASVAAMQNMGVSSGEIEKMLEGMASAGNAGAFETRDMAQHFAQLTASAKSLGIDGVGGVTDMAAALQIARRGAGDASTAANNMSNFLGKIMSPEVMKRFKTFGVDVTKELKKAHKQGISPIEHFIRLVDEKTKGGKADLLGQLFGDKQVTDFVRPMIADFKDYLKIRGDAENASGVIAGAYAKRMGDANEKTKALRISLDNLGTSIGANLLTPVGEVAQTLSKTLNSLDSRFTIIDEIQVRMGGLFSGLGLGDGKDAMKGLHDLIFGAENASAAADKYGRLFGQFQEYGRAIRQFGADVADNPVGRFLAEIGGKGLKLALAAGSITLVAGAITSLATALARITGITTAIGILRSVGKISGILKNVPIPKVTGEDSKPSGNNSSSGGWPVALKGVLAAFQMVDAYAGMPSTKEGIESLYAKNRAGAGGFNKWLDSVITTPSEWFRRNDNSSHPYRESDDGGRAASMDAYLAGPTGGKTVTIDASSIAAMTQPSGVQQVAVTNLERPNVTVHAPITISNISSPHDAVEAAASQLGQKAKAALESSFSGGGGF